MFARMGHAAFNTFGFNENGHDSDGVRLKDFTVLPTSAKSMTVISTSGKTFAPLSENAGKAYIEVGG